MDKRILYLEPILLFMYAKIRICIKIRGLAICITQKLLCAVLSCSTTYFSVLFSLVKSLIFLVP